MLGKLSQRPRSGFLHVQTGVLPCQQHLRSLSAWQVQGESRRRVVLKMQRWQVFVFCGSNLVVNLPSVSSWQVPAICRSMEA